jgi:hypothetical protein
MVIKKIECEFVDWLNLTKDSDKWRREGCSEHGNEVA